MNKAQVKIYNTLTRRVEPLTPIKPDRIDMFVCGPTVYDYIHIGNARTFVFFDVVAKYLRFRGLTVEYIQNITDIDDKIIHRAAERGQSALNWARDYEEKFLADMAGLNVTAPSRYARATDHISAVISQVKTLKAHGHAYLIEGDGWYFDLATFDRYGRLSGRTVEMADDAISRIDDSNGKRNRGDFALWKLSKPGEPSWLDPELGQGRPGWHIEDTAITETYFGPQYDLHGGGQDLMFPHHEAEIAQQESASGKHPFVRHWMHVAFLIASDQKMSKSKGNFSTARELLTRYQPEVLRHFLIARAHYRSPLQFNDIVLNDSKSAVAGLAEFHYRLAKATGDGKNMNERIATHKSDFFKAIDEDLNIPQAIASLNELITETNRALDDRTLSSADIAQVKTFLNNINSFLGIIPSADTKIPESIEVLVKERELARDKKDFNRADKIRREIELAGYRVDDTPEGVRIKPSDNKR